MPPTTAFLMPWQPAAFAASELERLLAMLPDAVYRKDAGLLVSILAAIAAELERRRDALALLGQQGFPSAATFAIGDWEAQLGLPRGVGMTTRRRQARAVTRRRGMGGLPIGRFMQEQARDALPHADELPAVFEVRAGHWAIFKPVEQGWPGDEAFIEAERRLRAAGPAAQHFWLAPHDTRVGLYDNELDLVHGEAIDVLTDREIDGGPMALVATGDLLGLALALE